MNAGRPMTLSQVRYVNKAFWRNPSSAFFTFAFPLMFLVIFTALLGNSTVHLGTRSWRQSTYYVAAMAVVRRHHRVLQQHRHGRSRSSARGDPQAHPRHARCRARSFLGPASCTRCFVAVAARRHHRHVRPGSSTTPRSRPGSTLVRFLVMLIVGAAAFCALGLAVTAVIPNADAAAPVVNATILPLLFLSGIFIPFGNGTPDVDHVDRPDLPGAALRHRHAGRLPGHTVPLDRRTRRGRVGCSRPGTGGIGTSAGSRGTG